jgi:peptidoglycan/LPS O-acetylase OafA/YrhL
MSGVAVAGVSDAGTEQEARATEPGAGAPRRADPGAPEAEATAPAALGYRPALDGLRAVAVLAVMVEHSGLRRPGGSDLVFPGGFLGVDVFFVISGFLITSLLLIERGRTGRIDLGRFWTRRARRLLPAVGVMVGVTCVVATVTDMAVDAATLRGDALASLGYVANWRFILTDQSYFAAFGLPSPFRHLWSLAVEEQWYLVFPPLLVGLLAVVRHRTGVLLGALAAAAVASAVWMSVVATPGQDPSRAYYGTDTRAHTLLVGALLAVVAVRAPALTRRLARLTPVLGVVGLAALAFAFTTVSGQQGGLYDGGFTVVAAVSLLAVAGVALPGARGPASWALGRRPVAFVGRLSYGLYLWHWPVFVFLTPDRIGLTGAGLAGVRMAVAFAIAGVSYVVVEQPVRRHGLAGVAARLRGLGVPRLRPSGIALTLAAIVVSVVVVSTGGRVPADDVATAIPVTSVPATQRPVTTTMVPLSYTLPPVPGDRPLRAMVGGDSQAWSLVAQWILRTQPTPPGLDLRMVADLGCTVTPGVPVVDGVDKPSERCQDWPSSWRATAAEFQPDVLVVMWGAWEVFDHRIGGRLLVAGSPEFAEAYRRAVSDSIDMVAAVAPNTRVVFATVPCMNERNPFLGMQDSPRNEPANLAWINARTAEVVAQHPGRATLVDLGPLACRGGTPIEEQGGVPVREDGIHFTHEYAPVVWDHIVTSVRPWLSAPSATRRP